jgi:hypothetical protein
MDPCLLRKSQERIDYCKYGDWKEGESIKNGSNALSRNGRYKRSRLGRYFRVVRSRMCIRWVFLWRQLKLHDDTNARTRTRHEHGHTPKKKRLTRPFLESAETIPARRPNIRSESQRRERRNYHQWNGRVAFVRLLWKDEARIRYRSSRRKPNSQLQRNNWSTHQV